MPHLSPSYRGPAIVLGVGGGFAFMGALPVAITLAIGVKTSATIIGMGFIGFGMLLIIPGICWCFLVQHRTYKSWQRKRRMQRGLCRAGEEEAPPLCEKSAKGYGGTSLEYAFDDSQKLSSHEGHESATPNSAAQELLSDHHDDS